MRYAQAVELDRDSTFKSNRIWMSSVVGIESKSVVYLTMFRSLRSSELICLAAGGKTRCRTNWTNESPGRTTHLFFAILHFTREKETDF